MELCVYLLTSNGQLDLTFDGVTQEESEECAKAILSEKPMRFESTIL